jgi:hypothetical protein
MKGDMMKEISNGNNENATNKTDNMWLDITLTTPPIKKRIKIKMDGKWETTGIWYGQRWSIQQTIFNEVEYTDTPTHWKELK